MSRKTYHEWKKLVEQQVTSGLSVPKFCEQQQLNVKYFYARKSIITKDNNNTNFIQANVVTQQATIIAELLNRLTHENV